LTTSSTKSGGSKLFKPKRGFSRRFQVSCSALQVTTSGPNRAVMSFAGLTPAPQTLLALAAADPRNQCPSCAPGFASRARNHRRRHSLCPMWAKVPLGPVRKNSKLASNPEPSPIPSSRYLTPRPTITRTCTARYGRRCVFRSEHKLGCDHESSH
jgi:hypothetical protein